MAGKRIKLSFQSAHEREIFRQKIYKIKAKQDAVMSAILDEEKMVLKTKSITTFDLDDYRLELWTEEKKPPNYQVLSIEEGNKESNDAGASTDAGITRPDTEKVSGDLAPSDERTNWDESTNPDSREDNV